MIALNRSLLSAITIDAEVEEQTQLLAAGFIVRGRRYLELGLMVNAIQDLITAIELDPTSVEAHEYRAGAHHELANVRKREIDLRQVNELREPDDEGEPGPWMFLAGFELAVRKPNGTERIRQTFPLTEYGRGDALLEAAATFSHYEWMDRPVESQPPRPAVYEVLSLHRELRLDPALE